MPVTSKLSDIRIRNLRPGKKPVRIADGGGLFIEVQPRGSKLWRLAYRFGGKQKLLSMGTYPIVTLAEARKRRDDAKGLLSQGVDPSAARRDAIEAEAPRPDLPTWRTVAMEFEAKRAAEGISATTRAKLAWLLELTYPKLADKAIAEITPPEVLAVLKAVEAKGQYVTAGRLRATMGQVFRYGVATLRTDRDPAAVLQGAIITPRERHHPAIIDPKGVGALMRAIRDYPGSMETRTGLLLLAYTFLRPGEVRTLEWGDVDWQAATLTISADRMKMPRPHIVPMAVQVVALLQSMRPVSGRNRLILSGIRPQPRPMSENTLNAALRRLGYAKDQMVSHGFRTTASTNLNELGYNSDWIEAQLAHVQGNSVRRAYNRAVYLPERHIMMQAWADQLDAWEAAKA